MKVLVADDDTVSRLTVQAAVEQLGHDCVVAEDGDQAWRALQETEVDVLITDWLMPGIDGPELCRRIRAMGSAHYTYIVLVTSRGDRDHVRTGMAAGADDYLPKPLEPFDLEMRLIAAERVTSLHEQLDGYRAELARLACTDRLTQLRNRLTLDDDLVSLHARSRRYGHAYSLAMCDIDAFKAYNDVHGHQAGDEVLRAVAGSLDAHVRTADSVYRFGGEEFLMVFPEQPLAAAVIAAERARDAVERLAFVHPNEGDDGTVTVSIGVAAFDPPSEMTTDTVLKRADEALYQAKLRGRNCVVAAAPVE